MELAPGVPFGSLQMVRILAWNGLGRVHLARMSGTRDGGPFENVFISVLLSDHDRIERYEIFDVADLDRVLARFEKLCAARA